MKNLLEIVTKCIDSFSERENLTRFAAIIGGEAVILHGIPRTTLDLDILYFPGDPQAFINDLVETFASFLRKELGNEFEVEEFAG